MKKNTICKKTKYFAIGFLILSALFISSQSKAQVKLDSMLTGCYPFSGNANDFSGHSNNGIVHGATLTQDRFGIANSAYHFDGLNSYIEVQNFDSLVPTDEVSISFWCIVYNGFNPHAQFQLQSDDNLDRFAISVHYNHNGLPSTFWDFGNIYSNGRLDTINIPYVSQWEHYVFISSASQNVMKEYRNDVLMKSENHHGNLLNRMRTLWIGKGSTLNCVDGDIDDIRFYNRVITPAEVHCLYANNPSCIDPCNNTAVNELDNSEGINIYPNPSNGKFIISINASEQNAAVKIFDSLGREIYNCQFSNTSINQKEIEIPRAGIYFVQVIEGQKQYTNKIVVQ